MAEWPVDLIRLEGEGSSVVLRLDGRERQHGPGTADVLSGNFLVDTPFVRGSLSVWLFSDELRGWQEALDTLDAGRGVARG